MSAMQVDRATIEGLTVLPVCSLIECLAYWSGLRPGCCRAGMGDGQDRSPLFFSSIEYL